MSTPTTGVVIVTHGGHGAEMLKEAQAIVGEIPNITAVTVVNNDPREATNRKIEQASYAVDSGAGVLFLVDLYGATPSNVCLSFMDGARQIEVLCGLNMAMLIKLATCDRREGPKELADLLMRTGRRSIRMGSDRTGRIALDEID